MTNLSRYIQIDFSDLNFEAKESLIETIKDSLMDIAAEEWQKFLSEEWHGPKPETWQEAYVRYMGINHIMWDDYESGEEERPSDKDWEQWLDDHLIEEAENRLYKAFKYLEIEVEI